MNSNTTALSITAIIIIATLAWTLSTPEEPLAKAGTKEIVTTPIYMRGDTQVVTINVKGGYTPQNITAKAGIPTEVVFITNNNFTCANDILIPALSMKKQLAPTGTTTVPLGTHRAGKTISGGCSMSMYNFKISFK